MANVRRILFGNKHFTSSTCGFGFVDSVHVPEEPIDEMHIRVRRVLMLFPGTTIELGPLVKDDEVGKAAPEKKEEAPPAVEPEKPVEGDPGEPVEGNGESPPEDDLPSSPMTAEEIVDDVVASAEAEELIEVPVEEPAAGVVDDGGESGAVDASAEPVVEDDDAPGDEPAVVVEASGDLENTADFNEIAKAAADEEAAKAAAEDEDSIPEDAEPVGETVEERMARMIEDHSKDELIEMAEEVGVAVGSRATKTEIATGIIAAQDAV